jgi:hypothetical protein
MDREYDRHATVTQTVTRNVVWIREGSVGLVRRRSSGSHHRSWRPAPPTTSTGETQEHIGGKASVQINDRLLAPKQPVADPTAQFLIINRGHIFV